MLNADRIAQLLTDQYGVTVTGEAADDADGARVRFHPAGMPTTQGFSVGVLIGWKSVDAEFTPGTFAAGLLAAMAGATPQQRAAFRTFIQSAINDGASVVFQINGQNAQPLQPETWPSAWQSASLALRRGPMQIDAANPNALEGLAFSWGGRVLGSVLSLLPLEPAEQEPALGEAEGGSYQALVTKNERSKINRAACIALQGMKCKVCGFDFEKVYGPIGFGYIEVHHVESVALLPPGTVLDPGKDLVPLCSNCHSMAHKRRPAPYTVDELKAIIAAAAAT